jgi:hypothetical protein
MPGRQQPGETRGTRRRTHALTEDERRLLRAVLKILRHFCGSWPRVSKAMGIPLNTLYGISKGKDFGSMKIAERAAKVAGVPVEALLEDKIISADLCPTCGQRKPG